MNANVWTTTASGGAKKAARKDSSHCDGDMDKEEATPIEVVLVHSESWSRFDNDDESTESAIQRPCSVDLPPRPPAYRACVWIF